MQVGEMNLESLKEELGLTDDPKPFAVVDFFQKYLLGPIGEGEEYAFKDCLKFLGIYYFGFGFFLHIGVIGHFVMSSSGDMFAERLESMFIVMSNLIQYGYMLTIIYLGKDVMRLRSRLNSNEFGRPQSLLRVFYLSNVISLVFYMFLGLFVVGTSAYRYYANDYCDGRKFLKDERFICGLITPAWFPFKIKDGIQKKILATWDCFYALLFQPHSCVYISSGVGLVRSIQIKIMDLRYQLDEIKSTNSEDFKSKFRYFVGYYTEILG
ncbi:hypothetical protein HHI36_020076 [Cryptolaemus montrouzieri]|uniref:Uncharacterized protein n=1 Tax=Cryptolaemus montrouzieri TaxID=559131 RepID=A0ABD2N9V4_9CUCU